MAEEKKEPKPKGGFREGAGRKPKDGVGTELVHVRLNKIHVETIRAKRGNISAFISLAVKNQLIRERLI